MLKSFFFGLKIRAFVVFVLIHAGLILTVYGIATLPKDVALDTAHKILIGGTAALYGGIFLTVFFILWPLVSLALRIRQLMRWRQWILKELPQIIALIPTVVEAIRTAFGTEKPKPTTDDPNAERRSA